MLNEIIKIIANDFIIIPVVLATVLFFRLKTREMKIKYVAVIVIAAVLALIFANIGRALVNNPRPFVVNPHLTPLIAHTRDNGFPSDHTLLSALLGFAMIPFSIEFGAAGLSVALLIGASRVMANVHHPLDIIGSLIFTFIAVVIASLIVKMYFPRKKLKNENPEETVSKDKKIKNSRKTK